MISGGGVGGGGEGGGVAGGSQNVTLYSGCVSRVGLAQLLPVLLDTQIFSSLGAIR